MEFSDIRPIFSGLIGGAIAVGLGMMWAKRVPSALNGMSAQWLLDNYRGTIRIANFLLAGGLAAALASYQFGGFSKHDWRPFAVGIGGGAVAALLALALVPLLSGGKPSEAYTAYAIAQKTPMLILYAILGSGIVLFGIGLTALLH